MEVIDSIEKISGLYLNDNIREKFWDMFIIDGLIGNTDRHNGNWGILVFTRSNGAKFAPIYDCGSCLNPMLEDNELDKISEIEIKNLAINCYSCIKENGKKINYMSYIKSIKNNECNNAMKRMFNKIDIDEINNFIKNAPCISNSRKNFYKKIICYRYEIMKDVYNKIK